MQEEGNSLRYFTYLPSIISYYRLLDNDAKLTIMLELLPNLRYRLLGNGTFCSKVRYI